MTEYREILRMHAGHFSQRRIAQELALSRNTVATVIRQAEQEGLTWEAVQPWNEDQVREKLYPSASKGSSYEQPDGAYMYQELKKTGVSLQMLWMEYCDHSRSSGKRPYMYSRYCDVYRQYVQATKATMHIPRTPGQQVEVDWAGKCGYLKDPATGELQSVYIFVATLSYSQYCYAEACLDMKLDAWILAHIHLFEYLGGVPKTIVPDNLKTGVSKVKPFEPDIQKNYRELAEHYNTFVMPHAVRRPTGKPNVEAAVNKFANKLLGTFRNHTFFTLEAFNTVLREELSQYNSHQFQKKSGSRATLFAEERDLLTPLPQARYELAHWKTATVQPNYHIAIDGMNYSVPFQYISKRLQIKLTAHLVEIYDDHTRIGSHLRLHGRLGQYATIKAHMPTNHQRYLDWDDDRFLSWGRSFGPSTHRLIQGILDKYLITQQGYKSCMGVLTLAKDGDGHLLEAACERCLSYQDVPSYQSVKRIFKTLKEEPQDARTEPQEGDEHAFIRNL